MSNTKKIYVSGGGSALKDALSNNFGDNIDFYVSPGIYDGGAIMKGRNCHIIGEYGKKNETIIDGHGKDFCLKALYSWQSPVYCHNLTFRNGYCSDSSLEEMKKWAEYWTRPADNNTFLTGIWFSATRNAKLYGCNVFDCSAFIEQNYNIKWGSGMQEYVDGGIVYPGDCYNCEISGNVSPLYLNHSQAPGGTFYGCDIHHNKQIAKDIWRDSYFVNALYSCKFHHNEISGQAISRAYKSLIYKNIGRGKEYITNASGKPELVQSYLFERARLLNCVVAKNKDFLRIEDSWGGGVSYINTIFFKNEPIDRLISWSAMLTNDIETKIINCVFDDKKLSDIFDPWGIEPIKIALSAPEQLFLPNNNNLSIYNDPITGKRVVRGRMLSGLIFFDNYFGITDPGFVNEKEDDYRLLSDSFLRNKTNFEDTMEKIWEHRRNPFESSPLSGVIRDLSNWFSTNQDKSYRHWQLSSAIAPYEYYDDEKERYLNWYFFTK